MAQDFGEMTLIEGEAAVYRRADGIFGLGYQQTSVNHIVPPFYNMINQDLIAEPVFAFYFSNSRNGEGDKGLATFGGVDDSHYTGDIIKLPLRRRANWEVDFDAITLGNETVRLNNTGASIDTGTSLLGLPSTVAKLMYALLYSFTTV